MGIHRTPKDGFISPIMRFGDTNIIPHSRPTTSVPRASTSKRIDSTVLPVPRQRVRTSICRRPSAFNLDNQNLSKYMNYLAYYDRDDGFETESHWSRIKRRLSSKDIVHHLFQEWVPQLCQNYRTFAEYQDREDVVSVVTAVSEHSDKSGSVKADLSFESRRLRRSSQCSENSTVK